MCIWMLLSCCSRTSAPDLRHATLACLCILTRSEVHSNIPLRRNKIMQHNSWWSILNLDSHSWWSILNLDSRSCSSCNVEFALGRFGEFELTSWTHSWSRIKVASWWSINLWRCGLEPNHWSSLDICWNGLEPSILCGFWDLGGVVVNLMLLETCNSNLVSLEFEHRSTQSLCQKIGSLILWRYSLYIHEFVLNHFYTKLRHVRVRHFYFQDVVQNKFVDVQTISAEDQAANLFTKTLSGMMFELKRN